jgi:hypothetical protein
MTAIYELYWKFTKTVYAPQGVWLLMWIPQPNRIPLILIQDY